MSQPIRCINDYMCIKNDKVPIRIKVSFERFKQSSLVVVNAASPKVVPRLLLFLGLKE